VFYFTCKSDADIALPETVHFQCKCALDNTMILSPFHCCDFILSVCS